MYQQLVILSLLVAGILAVKNFLVFFRISLDNVFPKPVFYSVPAGGPRAAVAVEEDAEEVVAQKPEVFVNLKLITSYVSNASIISTYSGVLKLEGDTAQDLDFGQIYGLRLWEKANTDLPMQQVRAGK